MVGVASLRNFCYYCMLLAIGYMYMYHVYDVCHVCTVLAIGKQQSEEGVWSFGVWRNHKKEKYRNRKALVASRCLDVVNLNT